MTQDPPLTKRCTKCGEEKPLTSFHRHARGIHGRDPQCKACKNETARERYHHGPKTPAPPAKSRWIAFRCEYCGNEMRYRRTDIEARQRRGDPLPRFCSRQCSGRHLGHTGWA